MKKVIPLLIGLLFAVHSYSQINFSENIAPIIYNHCTKCHREGEIGPFPMTSYEEISGYGSEIEYVTSIRYMPPWRPDHNYSHFMGENILSDNEIDMISEWVNNGMPQGNPDLEPSLPDFPTGSQVGVPDLVLTMEEEYLHHGSNSDQYQIFVLPTGLTEDKDIEAIEVRADNKQICHHAILGIDTTGTAAELDAQDPEYGYTQFGGFGFDPVDQFFTAWVPGATPLVYPPTIGKKLFANSDLLMQMHYGPTSIDQYDQTSVNIFYADDPIWRYVITYPVSPYDLEELFLIPPGQLTTFHGQVPVSYDVSLIGIAPHAHLLAKSFEVFAVSGDGNDTINLVKIPSWNFNWQGMYAYPNMLHIPAGYTVHCFATYDNTENNPVNPNDPPQWVTWGESTLDEMYLCYLQFVLYMPGDENISLATPDINDRIVYPTNQLFPGYPNPTRDQFNIGYSLSASNNVELLLIDGQGKVVKSILSGAHRGPGKHRETIDTSGLTAGVYLYQLRVGDFTQSSQLIITE